MTVSGVCASTNSYQATIQSNVKQRQQDFQSLADALQAGNLQGAQHAFAALQKDRSEEHTSELQSHVNIVCSLLLEKKKTTRQRPLRRRKEKMQRTNTSTQTTKT